MTQVLRNSCGEAEHLTLLKHCHENHLVRCQCHVVMSSVIQGFFLLVFVLLSIMSHLISVLRNHLNSFKIDKVFFLKKSSDDYILYISTRSCMFFKAVRLAIHFSAEVYVCQSAVIFLCLSNEHLLCSKVFSSMHSGRCSLH